MLVLRIAELGLHFRDFSGLWPVDGAGKGTQECRQGRDGRLLR